MLLLCQIDSDRSKRKVWEDVYESDDEGGESLLSLLNMASSMKKLKLLGNDGPHNHPGGVNNEVHVTQPHSLPASPISSPRPGSGNSVASISSSCQNSQTISSNGSVNGSTSVSSGYVSTGPIVSSQNNTNEDYWQTAKTGIRERNAAMCNNELMADIHFRVSYNGGESQVFPSHKYVLAVGSSVFFAMFYGSLAETSEEILVPDVEPEAFLKMLKYVIDMFNQYYYAIVIPIKIIYKFSFIFQTGTCTQMRLI